jgi:hypothetical protein
MLVSRSDKAVDKVAAPTCSLLCRRLAVGPGAGSKPAAQQIENLRYDPATCRRRVRIDFVNGLGVPTVDSMVRESRLGQTIPAS